VTRSVRSDRDVAAMTADSMASLGAYIVLAFVAAHLVAFFSWSNLGVITAIAGAQFLQSVGFTGIPLIVSFVLVSGVLNLFIGSASAKWAIMAPVFVPMLMLLGYSPELTQGAYRIGDSFTNSTQSTGLSELLSPLTYSRVSTLCTTVKGDCCVRWLPMTMIAYRSSRQKTHPSTRNSCGMR
jgi:p-aminobenzoyl-glutamate transporter AbgT